ncbi:Sec-independent protein translocase protein TatB [Pusillimonas noertemannii]|uniref:Sec-independent protein translocase protein TatB n=1 Tax=Pusillimonas noertemannii TaxID=305977 RepID=A0A2U1CNU4_9BURK|nr:Sec-independent protein translocase protein TatB [Pusillimonas noertemannii]NYT68300.1 twin-arginine translocase subunit TatB [Pusillimonas noertemannii]PVY62685.1 Sec-independent protein translocase TatB [Pusillimonas noertemannii]TFL10375.1 twin-arginine translocase subunit TatB [Pusillimonas noertemannii]
MFDISFSELMLIGVIALIVIGPERLPKVARTVGHLLGRAQRYVNDVKTDIRKEMDAAEVGGLKDLKDQMQEAANSVKASVEETGKSWRAPIDEAQDALKQASESIKTLADSAPKPDQPEPAQASGESAAAAPELPPAVQTSEQDMQDAEAIDTQTLPLPGFEREPAPAGSAATDSPPTAKGSQP